MAVNPQRSAALRAVEQGPQGSKFCLEGAQRRLVFHDPLTRRFERRFRLDQALLDDAGRFADGLELPLRRLRVARPPIEFVTQGAVAQRPCLQLGARLLLLLREKLTAAFQLAEFGLDRCALALLLVTLLLASESIRLESGLRFARAMLGFGGGLECEICRLQLDPGALGRMGQLINDAASGLLRGVEPFELALQHLERLSRRRVALLRDTCLVLALGKPEPQLGDRFLVAPARLARAEQRRAVLRVQRFELSDGLRGRRPLMVCRLLPGERLA